MTEHEAEPTLAEVGKKLPASPEAPEAPDTAEPPSAGSLEGEAHVSLEPIPKIVTAKIEGEEPGQP